MELWQMCIPVATAAILLISWDVSKIRDAVEKREKQVAERYLAYPLQRLGDESPEVTQPLPKVGGRG